MSNITNVLSFCHNTGSNRKIQLQCWLAQQISGEKGKTKTILIRKRNNKAKEIEKGDKAMEGKTEKKKRKESERRNKSIEKENISGLRKAPHLWLRSPETIILKIPKAESSNRIFLLLRKPLDQFKRNFEEETLFFHRPIKLNIWARKILFGSIRPSELFNWQLNTTNLTEFELLKSTWGG